MFKETFTILSKAANLPAPWPQRSHGQSHPHYYNVCSARGLGDFILSQRDDYRPGDTLVVDLYGDRLPGNVKGFIDRSPPGKPVQNTAPGGRVDSDVILNVEAVKTQRGLTEVTGKIFYFNPALKNLDASLKAAFKDSADIVVTTEADPYHINAGHTYTFGRLENVKVAGGKISARHNYTP